MQAPNPPPLEYISELFYAFDAIYNHSFSHEDLHSEFLKSFYPQDEDEEEIDIEKKIQYCIKYKMKNSLMKLITKYAKIIDILIQFILRPELLNSLLGVYYNYINAKQHSSDYYKTINEFIKDPANNCEDFPFILDSDYTFELLAKFVKDYLTSDSNPMQYTTYPNTLFLDSRTVKAYMLYIEYFQGTDIPNIDMYLDINDIPNLINNVPQIFNLSDNDRKSINYKRTLEIYAKIRIFISQLVSFNTSEDIENIRNMQLLLQDSFHNMDSLIPKYLKTRFDMNDMLILGYTNGSTLPTFKIPMFINEYYSNLKSLLDMLHERVYLTEPEKKTEIENEHMSVSEILSYLSTSIKGYRRHKQFLSFKEDMDKYIREESWNNLSKNMSNFSSEDMEYLKFKQYKEIIDVTSLPIDNRKMLDFINNLAVQFGDFDTESKNKHFGNDEERLYHMAHKLIDFTRRFIRMLCRKYVEGAENEQRNFIRDNNTNETIKFIFSTKDFKPFIRYSDTFLYVLYINFSHSNMGDLDVYKAMHLIYQAIKNGDVSVFNYQIKYPYIHGSIINEYLSRIFNTSYGSTLEYFFLYHQDFSENHIFVPDDKKWYKHYILNGVRKCMEYTSTSSIGVVGCIKYFTELRDIYVTRSQKAVNQRDVDVYNMLIHNLTILIMELRELSHPDCLINDLFDSCEIFINCAIPSHICDNVDKLPSKYNFTKSAGKSGILLEGFHFIHIFDGYPCIYINQSPYSFSTNDIFSDIDIKLDKGSISFTKSIISTVGDLKFGYREYEDGSKAFNIFSANGLAIEMYNLLDSTKFKSQDLNALRKDIRIELINNFNQYPIRRLSNFNDVEAFAAFLFDVIPSHINDIENISTRVVIILINIYTFMTFNMYPAMTHIYNLFSKTDKVELFDRIISNDLVDGLISKTFNTNRTLRKLDVKEIEEMIILVKDQFTVEIPKTSRRNSRRTQRGRR